MPKKTPLPIGKSLTPGAIIQMGEEIAKLSKFEEKQAYFLDFLNSHITGEADIWLKKQPKSTNIDLKFKNLPFDFKEIFQSDFSDGFLTFEEHGKYWYFFKLSTLEETFGMVIIKCPKICDVETLEAIASSTRIASLALYASIQSCIQNWREKQLTLVRSVSEKISQITDLELLIRQVAQLVQETFDYYYIAIFIINNENGRLYFKASACSDFSDRPEFENPSHPGFSMGEHIIGHVAETGEKLIANDVSIESRYKEVDSLTETQSEAVFPLKVESRVFGVFDVQSNRLNAFDDEDILVLQALASSISLAVESAHLYQDLKVRAEQLSIVSDVSRAITYILDIDELLKEIVELIHERFDFPYVHLYLVDPVQKKITFKAGSGERKGFYEKEGIAFDLNASQGIISWVANNRQTKRINNVHDEPLYVKSKFIEQILGSEMAVPLVFGNTILGVLDIQSDEVNAFSSEDQQLIETLADNIAIAIRNANLYRSEIWRRQVAESMRDVAGLLSENIDLNRVLRQILDRLFQILPCDVAAIWLLHPNDENETVEMREMHLAASRTAEKFSDNLLGEISFIPDPWIKNALTSKIPTIRKPEDPVGPIAKRYELPQNYSSIAAPLQIGEEVLGLIILINQFPGRFGTESQKISSAFANYAAIAIKNNRLYATSQEQAWISTILLQVAQATQSLTNLEELVSTIVRLTPMVAGVKGCGLFLREPESGIFSLYELYNIGRNAEDLPFIKPLRLANAPILNEMALTKETVYVRDPQQDLNIPKEFLPQFENVPLILIPLISREDVLGAFLLENEPETNTNDTPSGEFSKERLKIIQGIIQQTAIAVENIRLLEAKQEEAYVSTVLLQTAQAVVSNAELQDTLDSIVHIMPILVGIEASVIYRWDNEQGIFTATNASTKSKSVEESLVGTTYTQDEFPMLDVILRNKKPLVYPFTDNVLSPEFWDLVLPDENQRDPSVILNSQFPVLMGFPLSMKDDVFGVLLAQEKNISTNRERRLELISGIAQQASMAIQNDIINQQLLERQRLEREFQLAREIQQTFLPENLPKIAGWEMDVRWETARQVGGDFYDLFMLPDGRLAFVIADVSDKGLAASLYMAVTRTLIRAVAFDINSPNQTLERVNELLLSNSQYGLFVTVFYGLISLEQGLLTYTNAGHNPPVITQFHSNDLRMLQKGGIALGALNDIHLEQHQTYIKPGDCLVLYTDGVTEAFNGQDQMYGDERLFEVLGKSIGLSAPDVVEGLEADLKSFRDNNPLSDDTTILAICRTRSLADQNGDMRPT